MPYYGSNDYLFRTTFHVKGTPVRSAYIVIMGLGEYKVGKGSTSRSLGPLLTLGLLRAISTATR